MNKNSFFASVKGAVDGLRNPDHNILDVLLRLKTYA